MTSKHIDRQILYCLWRVEAVKQYCWDFVDLLELVDFDEKLGYLGELDVAVVDLNALELPVVVADCVAYDADAASYAEALHSCCYRMAPVHTLLAGNRTSFVGHGGDA